MKIQVKDIMQSPVATCMYDSSVGRAREIMQMKACHALPVVDVNGEEVEVKGMVTSQDLIGVIDENVQLIQVMSSGVTFVESEASIYFAAKLMVDKNIHHLVVSDGHDIVGIVSSLDFVKLIAEREH